jgi:hypothetical protein
MAPLTSLFTLIAVDTLIEVNDQHIGTLNDTSAHERI